MSNNAYLSVLYLDQTGSLCSSLFNWFTFLSLITVGCT